MALDLLRRSAYCKRKRRWVRAHHGGARRREHVRGRGAAIVGTSGDLPSAASEKAPEKVPKPRGNSEPDLTTVQCPESTLEWEPFEARPRSGGVGTRRCYAARRLPPRGWNSPRSVWRQAGYGGQRHDASLRSAFTLRTTIATSTFIIGVQRSSLAPGMTLLVFFWHEGGRK